MTLTQGFLLSLAIYLIVSLPSHLLPLTNSHPLIYSPHIPSPRLPASLCSADPISCFPLRDHRGIFMRPAEQSYEGPSR